ncbi:hypothetical protein [Streptacidiphilus sp. MAP12-33]|uniref:hypothetical protein n=1 Tax=Streptacidiphilus sp. MAP12-33 TaxID=3156266 RepID=UPI00351449F8
MRIFDFSLLLAAEPMQRSLAVLFAAKTPAWGSHATSRGRFRDLRRFCEVTAAWTPVPRDLDEVPAALLRAWWRDIKGTQGGRDTFRSVSEFLRADGRLRGEVAEELARRVPVLPRARESFAPAEFERVRLVAERGFRAALRRIEENVAHLERFTAGEFAVGSQEWEVGWLLDGLARTGDVPRRRSGHVTANVKRLLGGGGAEATWKRLFLDRMEATSLGVLLMARFGWNLAVISDMPVPRAAPDAGADGRPTFTVQIVKHRGARMESESIPDTGADSPGRLLTRAIRATSFARTLARTHTGDRDTDRLVAWYVHGASPPLTDPSRRTVAGRIRFGLTAEDTAEWGKAAGTGAPFRRGRRTVVAAERREAVQHTQATYERHYLLPDKRVQAEAEPVIAAGAADALDNARASVHRAAAHLTEIGDPAHQETVTADCSGAEDGPAPLDDGGCGASFLLCLGCENARIHPGHHPRLVLLHQALTNARSVQNPSVWNRTWGEPHERLEDLRRQIGEGGWQHAPRPRHHGGPGNCRRPDQRGPQPMTTTPQPIRDSLPHPATLVIPAHLAIRDHGHLNSAFRDAVWSLAPLIDDPSQDLTSIDWRTCPGGFREPLRLIAWVFLNRELQATFLRARGRRMRGRLSARVARETVGQWVHLACWLTDRGVHELTDCHQGLLHDYALALRDTGPGRAHVHKQLLALTRLWAFDQLSPAPVGVARPPWDEYGMDDYLPATRSVGPENARDPLTPATMGPLLIWAIRLVEELSTDILAARAEAARIADAARTQSSTSAGRARLDAYADALIATSGPVPVTRRRGRTSLARSYIAALTGASLHQVQSARDRTHPQLVDLVTANPGPCPLDVPVTATIGERPWRQAIDLNEVDTLVRHLVTAAFVVCAYLTGMRPQKKGGGIAFDATSGRAGYTHNCRWDGVPSWSPGWGRPICQRLLRSTHAIPTMLHLTQRRLEWLERLIWLGRHT